MTNSGSVENLGEKVQKEIIRMKVSGMSSAAIADQINAENNSDLTVKQIDSFMARNREDMTKILKEDKNFQGRLLNQAFDAIAQLKDLNGEMWKLFFELKKNPELFRKEVQFNCKDCGEMNKVMVETKSYKDFIKLADHLMQQIRHQNDLLGKLTSKNLTINYNVVDLSKKLTQVMPQLFERAERLGMIKGYKKRKKRKEIEEENQELEEEIEV